MKVLILITVGWFVLGCREFGAEKVFKAYDDVKVTGTKIQAEANVVDALAVKLGAILPGDNEIKVQHGGQLRRLIVTTPKTFNRQNLYPILFCFHGAGGKRMAPVGDGVLMPISVIWLLSVLKRYSLRQSGTLGTSFTMKSMMMSAS